MVRYRELIARARFCLSFSCIATLIVGCTPNSMPSNGVGLAGIATQHNLPARIVDPRLSSTIVDHKWKVDPSGGVAGGLDLWSVALNDSGSVGFAVGSGGVVLRWDGREWKRDSDAMRTEKWTDLSAVAVDASGKQALAVGAGGLVMRWDGTNWKHESAAEKLAIGRYLVSVRFDNSGRTAWVVGQYGMALHWTGSKWVRTPTPFTIPGFAQGGAPVDSFGMWAVWINPNGVNALASGNGNRILRWDGHTWKDDKQIAKLRLGGDAFSGIHSIAMAKDGKKGWMVGSGSIYLMWSGSEWRKLPSLADSGNDSFDLTAVSCDATGKTAFAIGRTITRWNGTNWVVDESGRSAAQGNRLNDVALSGSGIVGFAVGPRGVILRWDGKGWKRDPAGERPSYGQFSSVATTADGKSGLAVCFDGTPLRWDGNAWRTDTSRRPYMRLNVLWMAPNGDEAIGAGEEGIYRWSGSEWKAEPSGRSLHSLALTSTGQLGFAASNSGIIYRFDGSRWAEDILGTREARGAGVYAMSLSSDGKVGFAAGSDVFLQWDGSAWHRDAKLSKRSYNHICLNAKGDFGFASGSGTNTSAIMRWDGKAWRGDQQASKLFTDTGPYCLALSADGRIGLAVSFQGSVFFWNGQKWRLDAVATKLAQGQNLVSTCLDSAGKSGWVLGWKGFLMRFEAIDSLKSPGQ